MTSPGYATIKTNKYPDSRGFWTVVPEYRVGRSVGRLQGRFKKNLY